MRNDATDRLGALFRAARLHPPDERAAFLDAACDDLGLRDEVLSLLAADAEADSGGFLDHSATALLGESTPVGPGDPLVGRHVGPYRVLRPLGEGGMGAVYLAVREEPFLRHVALKVIRGGLGSPEAVQRFEQERQILASLDHPGIARLLDGGVTEAGLPYFALEYVEGRPITAFCDEHRLGIDARLALFAQVCDAVHTAHQNLVLHRDLKPSNVLVTASGGPDGGPAVRLLDFGIAKLLNPNLSPAAMPVTRTALRVLTPEYASPEQVRGEPLTTASDVYSLGVVLYELLAGRRPYRLTKGSADEIVRVVVEADPERPSTAAARDETVPRPDGTTRTVTADEVGAARSLSPDRLRRTLRGDLDTIVMQALRKEPGRRYASAEALAQDLDRYRRGLPVLAHRDSRGYRLRKLVRRHRPEAALVAVVLASVVGFAAYSQWQAGRLEVERDRVQTEATKAAEVSAFLVGLFERADPVATPGDSLTVRQLLDEAAGRVEADLDGQPVVQAAVLDAIAQAYQNFGRPADVTPLLERALALRREALGDDHPETVTNVLALADAYSEVHQVDRVEPLYRDYLAAVERIHGTESLPTAQALARLVMLLAVQGRPEAEPLARRWQATLDRLDATTPDAADNLIAMGNYLGMAGRYADGERYVRRGIEAGRRGGEQTPSVAAGLIELAALQNGADRPTEADATAAEAIRIHQALYPDGHTGLAAGHEIRADAAIAQGRLGDAEAHLREALAVRQRLHPTGHPTIARTHARLGDLARDAGRPEAAAAAYREAIRDYSALFGPDFPSVARVRTALAAVEG